MSFKAKFVAIGGKSGIGKTTLINSLIAIYPSIFRRPISYTTRQRREGEDKSEYIFISTDEIKLLFEQEKLVNLDFNYGNYYAMDKIKLTQDMKSENLIIIKEIHPQYHNKIKKLAGEDCVSVLVKGLEADGDIRGRGTEDDTFYELHGEEEFDLVYMYDKNSSKEDNAKDFYRKLMVYINTAKMFPPARVIDVKNAIGYTKVADEFTEEKRITTRNFHEVSRDFWTHFIEKLHIGDSVLELGPGNGWLHNSFEWPFVNYCCTDITSNMKSVSNTANGIIASARCIPIKGRSIDCVVASLADPYFYPEMLCEVNRILKDEALFVVTLPDKEWADNLRGADKHETTFLLDEGKSATVFSFTFSDEEITKLAEECGFSICQLTHLCGAELRDNEISPAITKAAENANKAIDNLNIITVIILKKGRNIKG